MTRRFLSFALVAALVGLLVVPAGAAAAGLGAVSGIPVHGTFVDAHGLG